MVLLVSRGPDVAYTTSVADSTMCCTSITVQCVILYEAVPAGRQERGKHAAAPQGCSGLCHCLEHGCLQNSTSSFREVSMPVEHIAKIDLKEEEVLRTASYQQLMGPDPDAPQHHTRTEHTPPPPACPPGPCTEHLLPSCTSQSPPPPFPHVWSTGQPTIRVLQCTAVGNSTWLVHADAAAHIPIKSVSAGSKL